MKFNIYDHDMKKLTDITSFVSSLWKETYNAGGTFSLEVVATENNKRYIRPDCFVRRTDTNTVMVIKSVQVQGSTIVATGNDAASVLGDSAFIGTINSGENIANALKNAYNSSNKNPVIDFSDSDLVETYGHQISNKSVLELLKAMCEDADIGYRSVKVGNRIEVQLYKPGLNANAKFSNFFGNIGNPSVTLSTVAFKNFAVVLGSGEGADRVKVDVDRTNGEARRTLIVDANDIQPEETETMEQYKERLTGRGVEKLMEHKKAWYCDFVPAEAGFRKQFNLGDIVSVSLPDYGLKFKTRITESQEQEQRNSVSLSISVGERMV